MQKEKIQAEAQTDVTMQAQEVSVSGDKFKDVIKNLMASGKCQRFNGVVVKNVKIEEGEQYIRVTLVTKQPIPGMISDDNGQSYHLGESNNVFTSTFALSGTMKEDEELSWMANSVNDHPNVLNLILNGSKVDIITHSVGKDEQYVNPFTTKVNPDPIIFEHDVVLRYIVGIHLGKTGEKMAERLADKLMGF